MGMMSQYAAKATLSSPADKKSKKKKKKKTFRTVKHHLSWDQIGMCW